VCHATARDTNTNAYPREPHRRQECETVFNIFGMVDPGVARSVTERLVSSDTTPAKPPSVRGNALTALRPVGSVTADGYVDFTPPDNGCGEKPMAFFDTSGFSDKECVQ
jgi:hypothetical protein